MRTLGIILLAVGYPVAIAVLVRLVPVLVQRRTARFVALESATVCIVAGWSALQNVVAASINGVFAVAFFVAWVFVGRSSSGKSSAVE